MGWHQTGQKGFEIVTYGRKNNEKRQKQRKNNRAYIKRIIGSRVETENGEYARGKVYSVLYEDIDGKRHKLKFSCYTWAQRFRMWFEKKAYVESDEIDWRRRKEIIHMKILLIEDDKEISKMLRSYLSACIVNAYKNKTMNLMFLYPIKRQKILISQMLAVWILGLWYSPCFLHSCRFIMWRPEI